jgi:phosphoribosylformylglycinamidine synthase
VSDIVGDIVQDIPAPVCDNIVTLDAELAKKIALELGLTADEFLNVVRTQQRMPSLTELYIYSLMWSEHCSYKHSKGQLRHFSSKGKHVLQGPGENAGVISVGDGWAVAFKMESHNHPSAIEPFQGAATGIGGIIRDIFTMGARPIAAMDSLRFGTLDKPRQRYLFDGAVAGIGSYGNCLGIPTVGGEVYFEDAYEGNCLINAFALGLMREEELTRAVGSGPGNYVVLIGSSTGRDGIGGASVLASQEFDEAAENKRPAVQVGDPFEEKLLIEVCLELLKAGKFVALGDLGAAGLTSSASEMASRGGVGIDIDVRKVPQREDAMQPFEIMVSESQERMLAVVKPEDFADALDTCQRWGVSCSQIGSITNTGRFVVRDSALPADAQIVADMPAEMLAESAPEYTPQMSRPAYLDKLQSYPLDFVYECVEDNILNEVIAERIANAEILGLDAFVGAQFKGAQFNGTRFKDTQFKGAQPVKDVTAEEVAAITAALSAQAKASFDIAFLSMLASPNICSRRWIWRQYDHQVGNNTVVVPGADAAVLRIGDTGRAEMTCRGIAMSTDCNGRYCYLDPYLGAQIALAEGMRNLSCVGAKPAAITDCLNFGNPEKPEVFYSFHKAVCGLATACKHYDIPVISGNVSFYNESFGNAIYPTPAIGIVGVVENIANVCTSDFKQAGDTIILVGETLDELGASEYIKVIHGLVAGKPPSLDLQLENDVQSAIREAVSCRLLQSAHDCSEGGLAIAIAESCIAGNIGAKVTLAEPIPDVAALFAESQSRIVISCTEANTDRVLDILASYNVPFSILGETFGNRIYVEKSDGSALTPLVDVSLETALKLYNDSLEQMVNIK